MTGTLNRAAVVLVVAAFSGIAGMAVQEGDIPLIAGAAVAAVAFACNWPRRLPKAIRIAAFVGQVMTDVAMAALLIAVLSLADAGTTGWDEVPWWFWAIAASVVFIVFRATREGYVLLNETH